MATLTANSATKRVPPKGRDNPKSAEKSMFIFQWEGLDKRGKPARGEISAISETQAQTILRRQGIRVAKIKKLRKRRGKAIKPKAIAVFTRQFATMMKAGVPLLQTFEIVSRGNPNPNVSKLLNSIKSDVETGTPLNEAFRKHPKYFSPLYCNLVGAGEKAGALESLLDRLALYLEKTEALKSKVKSALMYPAAVIVVAIIVVTIIMLFVIPSFKDIFTSFGAELPWLTRVIIDISNFFVAYWWIIFLALGISIYILIQVYKRNETLQVNLDRLSLKMPIFGALVEKSAVARWTRTLATMFGAGVPLVEALDSVGGAAGNHVFAQATKKVQSEVSTGTSLTTAMIGTHVFPPMVLQMSAIGEESGTIDSMLGKVADFYEAEVDDMVEGLSSLMEPIIIVVLGTIIGTIVVAMYLPIFQLGSVV